MIVSFRKKLKGPFAVVLVVFIAFIIGMWGIENYLIKSDRKQDIQRGEISVSKAEVDQLYQSYYRVIQPEQRADPEFLIKLKSDITEAIAQKKAYEIYFSKKGYEVSPYVVLATLSNRLGFDTNKGLNQIQQWLKDKKMESRNSIQETHQQIISQMVFTSIHSSTPNDLVNKQLIQLQNHHIRSFFIKQINANQSKYSPTDIEIKDYYQSHADSFVTPESIDINYIHIAAPTPNKPDIKTLETYYNDNKHVFRTPSAQKQYQAIVSKTNASNVASKEDIQKLKQEFISFDNANTFEKFIKDSKIAIIFQENIKPIINEKDISEKGSLSTQNHGTNQLILVKNDELIYTTPSFKQIQPRILQHYLEEKSKKQSITLHEKINELSFTHPDSLQPIKSHNQAKIHSQKNLVKDGKFPGALNNEKVKKELFSDDVYLKSFNSPAILLSDNSIFVFRIEKKHPSTQLSINKSRKEIMSKLIQLDNEKQANLLLSQLRSAQTQKGFNHFSASFDKPIPKFKPIWSKIWQMRVGESNIFHNNGSFYIVKVDSISPSKKLDKTSLDNIDISNFSLALYQQSILSDYLKSN
ncbi:MAG TPA: SurA N-terminal domain-containing protein [Gammaproteobacteria bacterium]|nr:SurA N-terminal domain-containing protein [Gammaproteobacteria bacterium]